MKDNNGLNKIVGDRIRKKRKERNLSREKMATMAEISDKFLYDIEVGNKGMTIQTFERIREVLEVSADWLLEGERGED